MTRRTNSRLAGLAFLLYIVFGIATMMFTSRATSGHDTAEKLASIAQHALDLRVAMLLVMFTSFCAIVLGVTLWAITRERDPDLAMLALACRVCEGLTGMLSVQGTIGLLWLATPGRNGPDAATVNALAAWLLGGRGGELGAIFFAVGSTIFAWLLLRGRMIPSLLAGWGVLTSAIAVVVLPLEYVSLFPRKLVWYVWLPLAAFEIPLACWLLFRGAAAPLPAPAAAH